MNFFAVFVGEFVFNLLTVMPTVASVRWWPRNKKVAVAWAVGGAIVVSLVMRLVEPSIRANYAEPIAVTLTNIVAFSLIILLVAFYLASETRWSNWKVDLAFGAILGLGLSVMQILALSGLSVSGIILHSIALAIAAALGLVGIRFSRDKNLIPALGISVIITLVITLIMSTLDHIYPMGWG